MLQDLDFEEIRVEARTLRGCTYFRRVRVGMPKVPQNIIDSVFYLYETEEDAGEGINPGGTGFVVSDSCNDYYSESTQYYGVTNKHVAVTGEFSSPVVSLNTLDGGKDVMYFDSSDWFFFT